MTFLRAVLLAALLAVAFVLPASAALEPVGSYDPGTPGMNASATGLDGFLYLGSWGSSAYCPGLGVRVVDANVPWALTGAGTIADYPRTTAEHVIAQHLDTPAYSGNVLFAGIQQCILGTAEGGALAAWDVSDPYNPRELSYLPVGRGSRGVHEFTVRQIGDRWYAFLAVPNSESFTSVGDFRVVDVTDPRNPVEVATWGAPSVGLRVGSGSQCTPDCRGTYAQAFLHSVTISPDATRAYLSYWDLGVLILDISNPAAPTYLGRFVEPQVAEGNAHSVSLTPDGRTMLVGDEVFAPPWSYMRVVDVSDPANPVQIGGYATPNSTAETPGGAELWYSIHNPLVDDRDPTRAYVAWYGDGVRLVDISNPMAPWEIGSWVPSPDPQVWSVSFMDDYLVVGDVNTGVYLLRR